MNENTNQEMNNKFQKIEEKIQKALPTIETIRIMTKSNQHGEAKIKQQQLIEILNEISEEMEILKNYYNEKAIENKIGKLVEITKK